MATGQRVQWVQESGPVGQLGWTALAISVMAIIAASWVYLTVGRYADWPDPQRRIAAFVVMALALASLCWLKLRRAHYVHLQASVGPEGIQAEWVRYGKPAQGIDRGTGWSSRREEVGWERVRSAAVRRQDCGADVQHSMYVQFRLRAAGGGMALRMPDAQTADRAIAILREHLPAKAVRVHQTILPTPRQGWWLAGLSLAWLAAVVWISTRWGYRPDVHNWWTALLYLASGPGIPWALVVTKGRISRSPIAIVGMLMSNVWTNLLAGVAGVVVKTMMEIG